MAQTVVELTLGTIRDLLVEEVKFLSGVGGQVKDVQTELQIMQSFLEEVDRKKSEEPTVLNFVKEIRSLCYRIEDVVDTYVAEVVLRKRRKGIKNILKRIARALCECKSVHEVGTEIAGIKAEISRLTARMERYGIMRTSLESHKSDEDDGRERRLRRTYGVGVEKDFVGMKKDIDVLVPELLNGEVGKNRVVSICGMGGLGKTTLGEKIYHHEYIRRGFEAFAWVCISKDYMFKNILHDMLVQLNPEKKEAAKSMQENELVREVHKVLGENKCLVVLDDVWELKDWKCLQPAFPDGNSKVFITTRKESVAKVGFFHLLGGLSEDEAWELLQKKAFVTDSVDVEDLMSMKDIENLVVEDSVDVEDSMSMKDIENLVVEDSVDMKESDENLVVADSVDVEESDEKYNYEDLGLEPQAMEQLGREMVRKCGYLPLAISVLGGILSGKKYLDAWKSLNAKIGVHMRGEGSTEKEIEGVLSLSYDDLPYRLKPCFLYLSRFPEDELILVKDLCLFWIAEGLVSPKDQEKDETLRDLALRYLSELASRSLVQLEADDGQFSVGRELNCCRVHDLLRDLSLAKSKEEEFFSLMDFRGGKRPSMNPSSATSCLRRLAIYVDGDQNLDGVPTIAESSQSLRSLSFHSSGIFTDSNRRLFTGPKGVIDLNKLNLLRFLYFESVYFGFGGGRLPTEMSKLIHLKFLGFRNCLLEELPSWVGDLPFLQALHLHLNIRIFLPDGPKIPNVLGKIKGLKYLFLPRQFVAEEKLVLDCLDELETLDNFDSNACQILDVSKLPNLRRLSAKIYGNDILSKFMDSIEASAKCLDLTSVDVYHCNFSSEEGMALLKKVFKSSKIHGLVLRDDVGVSKLPDYEPGFFPNLGELVLFARETSEDPMSTLEKLSNLRKLFLREFFGEEMTCHANGFPQLRHLTLFNFPNLKKWKVEKGAMPCLVNLRLAYCPKLDMIPDGIRFITPLQELYIADMPEAFMKRVEKGGEDFDKVCHVRSIIKTD